MAKYTQQNTPYTPVTTSTEFFERARGVLGTAQKGHNAVGIKEGISNTELDDITQIPSTTAVPDPGGIQVMVKSSSGNDTAAGTGVQALMVHYLDAAGLEQEETFIMNGTTTVDSVATDVDKIQMMHSFTVGSVGKAVGNISLVDKATGAIIYEYIEAGGNRSLSCRIHVPSNKKGFIMSWSASADTFRADIRLRATVDSYTDTYLPGVYNFIDVVMPTDGGSGVVPFIYPICIPSGGSVKVSAMGAGAGANVAASFQIILVDN